MLIPFERFITQPVSSPCFVMMLIICSRSDVVDVWRMRSSTNMKQGILLCGGRFGMWRPVLERESLVIRGLM